MIVGELDGDGPIETAVAVIGAGPAGIALSLALGRAGVSVALIESGGTEPDAWTAALAQASSVTPESHAPLEAAGQRRLGGASWIWGGRCVDFEPLDFGPRPFTAPGWPIDHAQAFVEAEAAAAFLGIGAPVFDEPIPWLAVAPGLQGRLERWCRDIRLARAHAAELRAGPVRVHTGLTCTRIAVDETGRQVVGLEVRGRSGVARRVAARHYVVAAGGLATARLLLASDDVRPGGIDGGSPWLGRGYMGHLQGGLFDITLEGLDEKPLDYRQDAAGVDIRTRLTLPPETLESHGLLNIAFLVDNLPLGDAIHGSGGLSAAALALDAPILGPRLMPAQIREIVLGPRRSTVLRHLANLAVDPVGAAGFAAGYLAGMASGRRKPGVFVRNPGRRYSLRYYAEQSPIAESRVSLSDDQDALGLRRLIVEKHIADADVDSVLRAHDLLGERLAASGLARLVPSTEPREVLAARVRADGADGYHQIGVARMGATPRDGVVDADCKVHGVANLHLAGSAVFPTSSQANPTYLIVCLALRLARRLAASL
jgi:choline dehydrogenase-like flavoprotein